MTSRLSTLVILGIIPGVLGAQASAPRMPQTPPVAASGFEDYLFPPELVMQHQRILALTVVQRAAITDAVKALQAQVVDFQWQIQDEQLKLAELVSQPRVEETAALSQIDRVLELERQIKRAHLASLIRIKNALTPEQQQQMLPFKQVKYAR